jgi:hypothetical protein
MLNTLGGFSGAMVYCKGIRLKEKGQRIKDTK